MLDYDDCLPKYVYMTEAKQSDVKHGQYKLTPRKSVIVSDREFLQRVKTTLNIEIIYGGGTTRNAMWIQSAFSGWAAIITLLILRYLKKIAEYG